MAANPNAEQYNGHFSPAQGEGATGPSMPK